MNDHLPYHSVFNSEASAVLGYDQLIPVSHAESPIACVKCPVRLPRALALCRWQALQKVIRQP